MKMVMRSGMYFVIASVIFLFVCRKIWLPQDSTLLTFSGFSNSMMSDTKTFAPNMGIGISPEKKITEYTQLEILLVILEQLKGDDFKILHDGHQYSAGWGAEFAKQYLARNQSGIMDAAEWIQQHTYRTSNGQIVYVIYQDGTQEPLRDVLLNKLKKLSGI